MATRTQFDWFKCVYDLENSRFSELVTRAKVYLSVLTFFLGALLFKTDLILRITRGAPITWFPLVISESFFFAALVMTILSLRILPYEGLCNPEDVIAKFGDTPPSDTDFLDDRIVDLAVATQRNSLQNDRRARCLQWAGTCMLVGFGLSLLFLLLALTLT